MTPATRARLMAAFDTEVEALLSDLEGTAAHSTTDHRSLVQTLSLAVLADAMSGLDDENEQASESEPWSSYDEYRYRTT